MTLHDVINPATEQVVAQVESTSAEETNAAIVRANRAFETWRRVAPGDRARLLRNFAALVDSHIEELAALEVASAGHTIGNARWEAVGGPHRVAARRAGGRAGWRPPHAPQPPIPAV